MLNERNCLRITYAHRAPLTRNNSKHVIAAVKVKTETVVHYESQHQRNDKLLEQQSVQHDYAKAASPSTAVID